MQAILYPLTLVRDEIKSVNILFQHSVQKLVHFYKGLKFNTNLLSEGCCQFVFNTGISGFFSHFLCFSNNFLHMQRLPAHICPKRGKSIMQ